MYRHKPNFNQMSHVQMYHKVYEEANIGDLYLFKPSTKNFTQSDFSFRFITGKLESTDQKSARIWVTSIAFGKSQTGKVKQFMLERELPLALTSNNNTHILDAELITNYTVLSDLWYNYNYKVSPNKLNEIIGDGIMEELWLLLDLTVAGR